MRIATFNIYWFGTSRPIVTRGPDDDALVARVLAALDADVLALQEICDLARLEAVLARASALSGRELRMRTEGRWVTSGRPGELTDAGTQKVVLAWDARAVEPVAIGNLHGPALRPPLVTRFRDVGGTELDVAAVHLKSGRLGAPMDDPNAVQRHAEATSLARFVAGEPWSVTHAPIARRVALGDMNARLGDPSLAPLWGVPGWSWPAPAAPPDDPWSTYLDRDVIDLFGASPDVTIKAPPRVWDWDRDPRIAPPGWFREVDGFVAQRARDFPKAPVENLYRVSDHRPVVVEVA